MKTLKNKIYEGFFKNVGIDIPEWVSSIAPIFKYNTLSKLKKLSRSECDDWTRIISETIPLGCSFCIEVYDENGEVWLKNEVMKTSTTRLDCCMGRMKETTADGKVYMYDCHLNSSVYVMLGSEPMAVEKQMKFAKKKCSKIRIFVKLNNEREIG